VARLQPIRALIRAVYGLYKDSGFSMAGAVAFGFVVSFFPFCIFLAALAGYFGGADLAQLAIEELFQVLPHQSAEALVPEVRAAIGESRIDLLTIGGFLSLFFATSAMEYLRAALNTAYRAQENRYYPVCLSLSALFVVGTAVALLLLTWGIVIGPDYVARLSPRLGGWLADGGWPSFLVRNTLVIGALVALLSGYHLWLAAGIRRFADVLPGVVVSVALLLMAAKAFGFYLTWTNYSRFYAGLAQIMVALVFFQFAAIIIMLGAEFNRGIAEIKAKLANRDLANTLEHGTSSA
jgi:membrane protein